MDEVLGWFVMAAVAFVVVSLVVFAIVRSASRKSVEERYRGLPGGGIGSAFDAVWSPSAHEAGIERDRQTKRTAPAPSPGDPPDAIDDGHITLSL